MKVTDNLILVIFGASGDLTRRKLLPALYKLYVQKVLPERFAILGLSRTKYSTEEFRSIIQTVLSGGAGKNQKQEVIYQFIQLTHYLPIEPTEPESYHLVKTKLKQLDEKYQCGSNCIFYLATPPELYQPIAKNLKISGISGNTSGWRRIIFEKPFGYDLSSAGSSTVNC